MDITYLTSTHCERLHALGFETEDGEKFDIIDLLAFLPEVIHKGETDYHLYMEHSGNVWLLGYRDDDIHASFMEELADEDFTIAIYNLVCWCRINNLI